MIQYKFKKGDRVVTLFDCSIREDFYIKKGTTGTVRENSKNPFVDWDELGDYWAVSEEDLGILQDT